MSVTHEHTGYIPGHAPGDVFKVGIKSSNIPRMSGLVIETNETRLVEGVLVRVGLTAAGFTMCMDARVTEWTLSKHVKIEGRSRVGRAAMWLNLHPGEFNGTDIDCGVAISPNFLMRPVEPGIARYLGEVVPRFANLYTENVIRALEDR